MDKPAQTSTYYRRGHIYIFTVALLEPIGSRPMPVADKPFRILSLDGGGAKGVYTLGVLKEIEALIGCPLWEHFDLVFGTSTGSIIAALTCLG